MSNEKTCNKKFKWDRYLLHWSLHLEISSTDPFIPYFFPASLMLMCPVSSKKIGLMTLQQNDVARFFWATISKTVTWQLIAKVFSNCQEINYKPEYWNETFAVIAFAIGAKLNDWNNSQLLHEHKTEFIYWNQSCSNFSWVSQMWK